MGKKVKFMGLVHTAPQVWAAFDGEGLTESSGSHAVLITPLTLSAAGDYIEMDISIPPADEQPLYQHHQEHLMAEWYPGAFARAVIGDRRNASAATHGNGNSQVSWYRSGGSVQMRYDTGGTVNASTVGEMPRSGRHTMRLEMLSGSAVLSCDGVEAATFPREAGATFTVSTIGDAALTQSPENVNYGSIMHTKMRLRSLTIRAGGVVTDFGNVVDSPLVSCHNVQRVTV